MLNWPQSGVVSRDSNAGTGLLGDYRVDLCPRFFRCPQRTYARPLSSDDGPTQEGKRTPHFPGNCIGVKDNRHAQRSRGECITLQIKASACNDIGAIAVLMGSDPWLAECVPPASTAPV